MRLRSLTLVLPRLEFRFGSPSKSLFYLLTRPWPAPTPWNFVRFMFLLCLYNLS